MKLPLATDWAEVPVPPVRSAVLLVLIVMLAVLFKRPLKRVLSELGISRLSFLAVDIDGIVDELLKRALVELATAP